MSDLYDDLQAGLVLPHEFQAERDARLRAEGARDALSGIIERQLDREEPVAAPGRLRSVS